MLLMKSEVAALVGYSPEHIRRLVNRGRFPKPICLNPDPNIGWSRKAWVKSEIDAWIAARTAARDAGIVVKRESEIAKRAAHVQRRPERDKSPTPPPAAPNAERPMLRLDPALGRAK
jgi:prophage regulatory protein